ncbi:MAG: hypothetical protein IKY53_01120 [Lachnospiraceae bacterium]|nr:hypothetical protein [Lachnospiraceae bacterium]
MKKLTVYIVLTMLVVGLAGCKKDETMISELRSEETVSSQTDVKTTEEITEEPIQEISEEKESEPVSEENTNAVLETLKNLFAGEDLMFETELGKELFQCSEPQENAVDFTGEWSRTNVILSYESNLIISNQDEEGFDVSGETYWYAHMGELYGEHAYFLTENVAILEYYNESLETYSYLLFRMEDGTLWVYATGAGADFEAGANCFWHGEYVQGEPVYENVNVMQDTFTEEELETIGTLLGEEQFEDMFVFTTENGSVIEENCTLADGTAAIFYNAFVPGIANYNYYNLLIDANGAIYIEIGPDGMFYSTVDGLTEMPQYTTAG